MSALHQADERRRSSGATPRAMVEVPANPLFRGRYAKEFLAGWRGMDFNGHLANTAYLDLAADVRLAFFAEHGFPPAEFRRLGFGPVIRKDEVEYFREVGLHDTVTVTYALLGMSPDGARFVIENEIWSAAGERAATVKSTGGWLDLRARKLVAPPPALLAAFMRVPRSEDFVALPVPSNLSGNVVARAATSEAPRRTTGGAARRSVTLLRSDE